MALRLSFLFLLLLSGSVYAQQSVEVMLAGFNHEPAVRTTAMGMATITVSADTLYIEGDFSDLMGNYGAAYIHYGARGKVGHRMFRLTADVNESRKEGVFRSEENQFVMTEAQRDALRKGMLYINISSDRFRQGEVRGQIPGM